MMDLRDDGTVAIDFGETTIVVNPPPTLGAYRRVRAELEALNGKHRERVDTLKNDPEVSVVQFQNLTQESLDDVAIAWWQFVMVGDESFKGLAEEPPPEVDSWPVYLSAQDSLAQAMAWWRKTPLAFGGKRPTPSA